MPKHYSIEIKIKNNFLLAKMREAGFPNASRLARASGISQYTIGHFLNLKLPGMNCWSEWRHTVVRLAEFLRCMPEDLFPPQHVESPLKKTKAVFEADAGDMMALNASMRNDALPALDHMARRGALVTLSELVKELPTKERKAIDLRYGLTDGNALTYKELGERLGGVSAERARQIEHKALRRLKSAAEHNKGKYSNLRDLQRVNV